MRDLFWIGIGGALGSIARFLLSALALRHWGERLGETLPWGTLMVNITGSFLIGFLFTATGPEGRWPVALTGRHFLLSGICGGYTTFSSFSLQTLQLAQNRAWLLAGINVAGSVVACLAAVWLGHLFASALGGRR